MKKFTVYLMSPTCVWEGVEANSMQEAINECSNDPTLYGFDFGDRHAWDAVEEYDDEEYEEE